MSIPRLVDARLHPKKPIDLIATAFCRPVGPIQFSPMKAAASSQVSTCLPSISDSKHVPVITMTGSESVPRMADHRSQPTRGKSVAFHILELLALQRS
jgi:hypothetical protein